MGQNFKNILIVRTDRIGDVVLTSPVFKSLRKAHPQARITVLVSPATYDLVAGNPYIDQVMVDDRNLRHKDLFGFLLLAREIRQGSFDVAFIFHTKRRYNVACYVAGIEVRTGFKNNKFGFLLTHPVEDHRHLGQKHEAQYGMDVLGAMGIESSGLDVLVPVQKRAEEWAQQWFLDNNIIPHEVIAIHPGSSDPAKCWSSEHFAKVIDSLIQRYSLKIVLVGGRDAVTISKEILGRCVKASEVLDLTGKTTVGQTASLLRRCRLLISNDSGPAHIAAAVGISVIALFLRDEPGINPGRWRPLGGKVHILVDKSGSIAVDAVLEEVENIFSKEAQSILFP